MASVNPTPVLRQKPSTSLATPTTNTNTTKQSNINSDSSSSDASLYEPTATMPARNPHRPGGRGGFRREIDLSGLLNPAQKVALAQLINGLTESMRQQILSIFETPSGPPSFGDSQAAKGKARGDPTGAGNNKLVTLPLKETAKPIDDLAAGRPLQESHPDINLAAAVVNKCDGKEPKSVQSELQKDVLTAFKKWQTAVVKRIGDISTGKEFPPQPNRQGTPRFTPKPPPGKQAAKASPPPSKIAACDSDGKAKQEGKPPHGPH